MTNNKYTTISGDMWDAIAFKTLGDIKYTDKLIKANIEYVSVYVFPAGVVLNVPDIDEINDKEVLEDEAMPAWKRGVTSE